MNNIIINCTLGIACIFVAQGDSVTFDRNVSIQMCIRDRECTFYDPEKKNKEESAGKAA